MITSLAIPTPRPRRLKRFLAIDPISRGFGFAVLEGPDCLIDWGVVQVRIDPHRGCLTRIGLLIERYRPDSVVTEDVSDSSTRRGARVRKLVEAIRRTAAQRRLTRRSISRKQVRHAIAETRSTTKHQIASVIAERFSELRPRLPRPRKCYESQDERMAIFGAVALGLALMRATSGSCTRSPTEPR